MTFEEKCAKIQQHRMNLRDLLIKKLKTNPNREDSETLRKLDGDIIFWSQQTDTSIDGLMQTLYDSIETLED